MKIHNFTQGDAISEWELSDWEKIRKGKITASVFKHFITPAKLQIKDDKYSRDAFKNIIASKKIFRDSFQVKTKAMQLGNDNESSAIDLYQKKTGNEIISCGFVENENYCFGYAGFSPDGLIYERNKFTGGIIEVKTQCPKKHFSCADDNFELWLKEYKHQPLFAMTLCPEVKFCDCISYNPDIIEEYSDESIFIHRYYRNEEEIEKAKIVLDYWVDKLKKI